MPAYWALKEDGPVHCTEASAVQAFYYSLFWLG